MTSFFFFKIYPFLFPFISWIPGIFHIPYFFSSVSESSRSHFFLNPITSDFFNDTLGPIFLFSSKLICLINFILIFQYFSIFLLSLFIQLFHFSACAVLFFMSFFSKKAFYFFDLFRFSSYHSLTFISYSILYFWLRYSNFLT